MKLKGKVAIVTGAGRGIGRAIAVRFAREGATVGIVSRTGKELQETEELIRREGGRAVRCEADVSNFPDVQKVVARALDLGSIDILVNNAGIQPPIGPLAENDVEAWVKTIQVNLLGTFYFMKCVLPIMIKKRQGKIINLSGGGSTSPRPRFSAYASSKAAVVRLTETVAAEVKEFGIDVNAIAPGAVNTRMLDEIIEARERSGNDEFQSAMRRAKGSGTSIEKPVDLALFLASQDSNGITGKLISAEWDPWEDRTFQRRLRENAHLGALRRIDDKKFFEKT